jgi:hypothetical protein
MRRAITNQTELSARVSDRIVEYHPQDTCVLLLSMLREISPCKGMALPSETVAVRSNFKVLVIP